MKNNNVFHSTPHNRQNKGKVFGAQKKAVCKAFKKPSTMLMVSIETGVLRANICRYVAEMRRKGTIEFLYHDVCPISKCRAGFYRTYFDENG